MQVKKTIQHWLPLKAEEMEGKIHYASKENQSTSIDLTLLDKWKVKSTTIVKKPIDICWLKVAAQMEG